MNVPHKRRSPGGNRGDKSNTEQRHNDTASQRAQLLAALRSGPLTTLDARERFGVMHPAARVQELRNQGHPIVTVRTDQVDSSGQKHRIAQYLLQARVTPSAA